MTTSWILISNFLEYGKLIELTMVQIMGNVEDEKCLSIVAFMKCCAIGSLPTYQMLCTCLHNSSILCKIYHMWNVLSNGEQHVIDIAMMVRL
jgi:hypothetical protein